MAIPSLPRTCITVFLTVAAFFLLSSHADPSPNHLSRSVSSISSGRSILALKGDPLKTRLDQILKQANDHKNLLLAYASYARKLKLENSKHLRILSDLARNFSDLISRPASSVSDPGVRVAYEPVIDEPALRIFEKEVKERIKLTRQVIADAKGSFDNQLRIQKLKDSIFALNELLTKAKKQSAFSNLIAAKSIPKSIHCLAMRLMEERIAHPKKYDEDPSAVPPQLEDPKLFHYAIFSDNVIAASVVVNSAVMNAKEPSKHVFHVVTDKMNLGAMQVMFKMRDYNGAHVEVKAVEEYKFLNSSYVPVLRQLESAKLQQFYFENRLENATKDTTNMKFRNPKYLSMLNHLRFYLPEMYPKLHKILFLDDDVVVQRDLTALWNIDMDGKVNGAVETCFGSFHRYAQYMNFSHPLIKEKFNPKACGWAYGMNFFDLDAWRKEKCTEQYHYWQNLLAQPPMDMQQSPIYTRRRSKRLENTLRQSEPTRSPICTRRRSKMLKNRLRQSEPTTCIINGDTVHSPMMEAEIQKIKTRGAEEKNEGQIDNVKSPVRTQRRSKILEKGFALSSKSKVADLMAISKKAGGHKDTRSPICTRRRSKMFQNGMVRNEQSPCTATTVNCDDASNDTVIDLINCQPTTFTLAREQDVIPMNKTKEERTSALEAMVMREKQMALGVMVMHEKQRADAAEMKAAKAESEVARLGGVLRALQLRVVVHLEKMEESTESYLRHVDKMDNKVQELEHAVDHLLSQHEEDKKQMEEEHKREKKQLTNMYQKEIASTLQGLLGILAKLRGE